MTGPIVILGGLFSTPHDYYPMRDTLAELTGERVYVVDVQAYHWFGAALPAGWGWHLDRLEQVALRALAESTTGKITLIGHSIGGIIGRLFLSPRPFQGRSYGGVAYVDHLITLGSPHNNYVANAIGYWGQDQVPGAVYGPDVRYTSVSGATVQGDPQGSLDQRSAYGAYRLVCGCGTVWGDGLIPVHQALLAGSQHITLGGVAHAGTYGRTWYGSPQVVREWWAACSDG